MARTIQQIQDAIVAAKNADALLGGLTSTSDTALWKLWTYIVAFCQWSLEVLYDAHKAEVKDLLQAGKVHTRQWYVTKAKEFQYGITLPSDTDVYPAITASALIVTKAAAEEVPVSSGTGSILRIKVAKGTTTLSQLSTGELAALNNYFNRIKDAGVRLQATSGPGDELRLSTTVFYDPLVLDNTGARLDATSPSPVQDAIDAYLLDMGISNFNGALVLNKLVNIVLAVDGVVMFTVNNATAIYTATTMVFTDEYKPDAGYLVNNTSWFNSNVNWVAHDPI